MQEEVEHKMVLVVEGVIKMTPRVFLKALKQAARLSKGTVKLGWKGVRLPFTVHEHNLNKERHGKMTVKQLSRQHGIMSQFEVEAAGLDKFTPIAQKYGIDFAIRKVAPLPKQAGEGNKAQNAAEGEPEAGKSTYLIFFKGVDGDTLERAYKEYSAVYDPAKTKLKEQNGQEEQTHGKKPARSQPAKDGRSI